MFVPDRVLEHVREMTDAPDLGATKYRIVREIGRGGMGAVWAAEDTELAREVAIKVSTSASSSSELLARLRREARVIARLEHPGIVPVHDIGELPDGRVFYVMKLVRGQRLDVWAKGRDRRVVLRLFQRVCEAVAFAHARGVLHRDLKPENVMVGEFGEALVMDWGIARVLGGAAVSGEVATRTAASASDAVADTLPAAGDGATLEGTVMGTPAYMAPEQARGDTTLLDAQSDVYGLGAILYFLLAGAPPYPGTNGREVLARVLAGEPAEVRAVAPAVERPLVSIQRKAMARARHERYRSATELGDDIGRFLDGERALAHRENPIEIVARFAGRHRVVLLLFGVYLVVRVLLAALAR